MSTAPQTNELDARTYSRMAGFAGDWRDCWWNQDYLELLARRVRLAERAHLLDVGCGVGHWGQRLLALAGPETTLTGVDREAAFLDQAKERAAARGQERRSVYLPATVESLPFPDGHFDAVTCQTVLMHVTDPRAALREMVRVLAPGGLLLVAEPDNLVNALSPDRGPLRPSLPETLALAELQQVCAAGKQALGHGDECIGSQLFGLFHEQGLERVRGWSNDKVAALAPPYAEPCQQRDRAIILQDADDDGTMKQRALRHWQAAGGEPTRFSLLWARRRSWQERVRAAARAGTFVRGGGFLLFVCAGEKAAG
jgi:SAM-dependent methyltransferase